MPRGGLSGANSREFFPFALVEVKMGRTYPWKKTPALPLVVLLAGATGLHCARNSSGTVRGGVSSSIPLAEQCSLSSVRCVPSEYRTIQAASNAAAKGDTILVFSGNYAGFSVVRGNTTYKANSADVVIDTGNTAGKETGNGVYIPNVSDVTIDGFTISGISNRCISAREARPNSPHRNIIIKNVTCLNSATESVYLSQVADSVVENCTVNGTGRNGRKKRNHGIYLANAGSDNTIIRGNTILNVVGADAVGIHVNGDLSVGGDGLITNLVIERNIIHDVSTNAIHLDGVQNTTIRNNLIYSTGRNGIRGDRVDGAQGPKHLKIYNNTIVIPSGGGANIKMSDDLGGHDIRNNILINEAGGFNLSLSNASFTSDYNLASDRFTMDGEATSSTLIQWQGKGYDAHSVNGAASEVFVGGVDYSLKPGSAAIDRGVVIPEISADINGVARPQGSGYDIGAYEKQ